MVGQGEFSTDIYPPSATETQKDVAGRIWDTEEEDPLEYTVGSQRQDREAGFFRKPVSEAGSDRGLGEPAEDWTDSGWRNARTGVSECGRRRRGKQHARLGERPARGHTAAGRLAAAHIAGRFQALSVQTWLFLSRKFRAPLVCFFECATSRTNTKSNKTKTKQNKTLVLLLVGSCVQMCGWGIPVVRALSALGLLKRH